MFDFFLVPLYLFRRLMFGRTLARIEMRMMSLQGVIRLYPMAKAGDQYWGSLERSYLYLLGLKERDPLRYDSFLNSLMQEVETLEPISRETREHYLCQFRSLCNENRANLRSQRKDSNERRFRWGCAERED